MNKLQQYQDELKKEIKKLYDHKSEVCSNCNICHNCVKQTKFEGELKGSQHTVKLFKEMIDEIRNPVTDSNDKFVTIRDLKNYLKQQLEGLE